MVIYYATEESMHFGAFKNIGQICTLKGKQTTIPNYQTTLMKHKSINRKEQINLGFLTYTYIYTHAHIYINLVVLGHFYVAIFSFFLFSSVRYLLLQLTPLTARFIKKVQAELWLFQMI